MTTFNEISTAILATSLPTVRDADLRSKTRKERSTVIRGLLRDLGFKGISVTTPSYSMARTTEIRLPDRERCQDGGADHVPYRCPACSRYWDTRNKLTAIILAAFPNMDDRSDTQSDYFDYVFSVD